MRPFEIILSLALAIYSVFNAGKWKELSKTKRVFVVISILLAITIAYNAYSNWRTEQRKEKIEAKFGEIEDYGEVTFPVLQIGDNGATFPSDENGVFDFDKFFPQLKLGKVFRIFVKKNKLYVSTIIRDRNGQSIAVIENNEWEKYDDVKGYDYNNDDNAFEVIANGDRNVCFQIDLKNGVAHFAGFVYNTQGDGISFANTLDKKYSAMVVLNKNTYKLSPSVGFPPSNIPPIFKYPRAKYIGERSTE